MQEASPSLLVSKLGIDPLPAAFACLISALLLALLYPALHFIDRRTLARSGCLRVFHARTSGPDTLLYCVQPVRDAPVRHAPRGLCDNEILLGKHHFFFREARWRQSVR